MDRIYCDSNVYRILKSDHPYHKVELHNTFEELKDKFLFVFSDAHLDDLSESIPKYRDNDLEFMGRHVKDNFFSFDHVSKKEFQCLLATPMEAYKGKDYAAVRRFEKDPWNFDNLFPDDPEMPELNALNKLLKSYLELPITALAPAFDMSTLDEKNKAMMDNILPGYHSGMSIREMMESSSPFSAALLTDDKKVTELRKFIAKYINRDNYSFETWGMSFNEKFKETGFGKTFLEMVDSTLGEKQKDDFYLRFTNAYSLLEMYNITQEKKSGGGLKKFDYSSLNTDAMHAYYASYCDYLVTDDKGLQVKAQILYQMFVIPTKILSIQDLLDMRSLFAGQEETIDRFTEAMKYDMSHAFMITDKYSFKSDSKISTYKTTHNYFNYFNRFQIIRDQESTSLVFYCERLGPGNFVMYRETELLVGKLMRLFGYDLEKIGPYTFAENNYPDEQHAFRRWKHGDFGISLVHSRPDWGNFLCLCFDFLNTKSKHN